LVWDLQTGHKVLEKEVAGGIGFPPASGRLALHTPDGNITVYRLPEGEEAQRIELREPAGLVFSFDPTGRKLACVSTSKESLQILDIQAGRVELAAPHPKNGCVPAWSADGRWLATAGYQTRIDLYDTVRRHLQTTLEGNEGSVIALAFSPQGNLLVSAGSRKNTHFWDLSTGKQRFELAGEFARFDPTGQRLAYWLADGHFGVWELAGVQVCRTLYDIALNNARPTWGTWGVDFSKDGSLLASASNDGVRLWDTATARLVSRLEIGYAGSVQFNPHGGGLLTHGALGLIYWPLGLDRAVPTNRRQVGPAEILSQPGHDAWPPRASWDRQGQLAFTDPPHRGAVLWNREPPGEPVKLPNQDRPSRVQAIALSADGHWAAVSYWQDAEVRVWETRGPKLVRSLAGGCSDNDARQVGFSPDSHWLIVGGIQDYRWWRLGTWEMGPVLMRDKELGNYAPLAFTQDGDLLAITRTPYAVQLVDPVSGQEYATVTAPDRRVITWLAFSPDGAQLAAAAAGRERVIDLWDLRLLRRQLGKLGLDWDRKPYLAPDADQDLRPLEVTVLPGAVRTGAVIAEYNYKAEHIPVVDIDGTCLVQPMDPWGAARWSNGRQLLCKTKNGGYVELELDCPRQGRYRLDIAFTRAEDYGIAAVSMDGKTIGKPFDGYHELVSPSGLVSCGAVQLSEGRHRLRFTAIDKNPMSKGYFIGVSYLTLRQVH
jgi:WD40 repeat protein